VEQGAQGLSFRGGASIGWINASWPFAALSIKADRMSIACAPSVPKIWNWGTCEFSPGQVISIRKAGFIPVLAWGIRVTHNRVDYPRRIIFWSRENPRTILGAIEAAGFFPAGQNL
jgi:hypothetical protein